jgi:hypothetical protein
MEHAWERVEHRVERADVTAEESADHLRPIGTTAAFDHFEGGGPRGHLPEELQHGVLRHP